MPCNSDYMEPTAFERSIIETAKLLVYVLRQLTEQVPKQVEQIAKGSYTGCISKGVGDNIVEGLCETMHKLSSEQVEALAYAPRTKEARALANWWEEHQEADRKREAIEAKGKLDRGYLFPKGTGVPKAKKDQVQEWYNSLNSTGQGYVNMLLLIRDNNASRPTAKAKD